MAFYLQTDTYIMPGDQCVIRTVAYTDDTGNLRVVLERHEIDKPPIVIGQSIVQLPAAPVEVKADTLSPPAEPPKAIGNGNGSGAEGVK